MLQLYAHSTRTTTGTYSNRDHEKSEQEKAVAVRQATRAMSAPELQTSPIIYRLVFHTPFTLVWLNTAQLTYPTSDIMADKFPSLDDFDEGPPPQVPTAQDLY